MKRIKAFTLAEISVVFGLIVLTALLVIPNLVEDNKKLDSISKWKNSYHNIEYVFSALGAQMTETDEIAFKNAKDTEEKETLLFELLNPYFRMTEPVLENNYKVYFLNGLKIESDDEFYIKKYYKTSSGKIIGLKWFDTPQNLVYQVPIAVVSVDLNGEKRPNKWGYDVFGIYIFKDRIEPIGKTGDEFMMKSDCSKKGKGVSCSYYYYIYGGQLN